jgi:hypothetical protein
MTRLPPDERNVGPAGNVGNFGNVGNIGIFRGPRA